MYKIGDFSKIVDIPVRTLRYYAEYGVLVPSVIDPFTGYKYYSEKNVIECEMIKLLKSLDFTLDEIKRYRDNLTEEAIERKKSEIEERMALLKAKYDNLNDLEKYVREKRTLNGVKVLRRENEKGIIGEDN